MTDAELTVAAVRAKRWEVVKLRPRDKTPTGAKWEITTDPAEVACWIADGFNVGLVCHERTGVAALDPDEVAWADMVDALGQPSLPWVLTGSGRLHYYFLWEPDLPAKLEWRGEMIGEIQRGPGLQQVVMPPSIHPATGLRYRWITEALMPTILCEPVSPAADPLPRLPGEWRAYLTAVTFERRYGRDR